MHDVTQGGRSQQWCIFVMVFSCCAVICSNRQTTENKDNGVTFHRVPKNKQQRKLWVQALCRIDLSTGQLWEPTNFSYICSQHFRPGDFDRTGQTVRLRKNVVPSVFLFPSNFQPKPVKKRTTNTSQRKLASDVEVPCSKDKKSLENLDSSIAQTIALDHSYVITDSPRDLKRKLDDLIEQAEDLQQQLYNATHREKCLHTAMGVDTLEDYECDLPE
ncbi:THAP domain-containing protein 6-like [Polyodon spathula]|uniref:THAP domain-containing protein 6-like n=1 Tax=Polyodon spathula TaxID=7913 RepID=UPI001B7E3145|nr:THAP domain-containing protein 6-like [Polyodon spathula]